MGHSGVPRMCRWFGHKWHWPPSISGVTFFKGEPDEFFASTGGFDLCCERCGATEHTYSDLISDGRIT